MDKAHVVSLLAAILYPSWIGEAKMSETEIILERMRQVAVDSLWVVGFVLLLSAELPF